MWRPIHVFQDIKPENILLGENDEPKLCDFDTAMKIGSGNFDIVLDQFSRGSQLHAAPHVPRGVVNLVPVRIRC